MQTKLRNRGGSAQPLNSGDDTRPDDVEEQEERGGSTPPWLAVPTTLTLGCLLLLTLWMLYSEKQQVMASRYMIKELKTQVKVMKEEMSSARRIALRSDAGAAALKGAETVKALEADKAKLQAEVGESHRKLQEMINRMTLIQSEKGKLLAQVQALIRDKRLCSKKLGLKSAEGDDTADTTGGGMVAGQASGGAGGGGGAAKADDALQRVVQGTGADGARVAGAA